MKNAFFAWSGGKDSALALYRIQQQQNYQIKYLLTTVTETYNRVTMHGVRLALLEQQAQAIGIPLKIVWVPQNPSMAVYEACMHNAFTQLKNEGITTGIFGDIFLTDLRKYREEQLGRLGMEAVFPLWQNNSLALVQEFIGVGFKAQIICVSHQRLGQSFINQPLNQLFLDALPDGVDAAGENGEYHSFVYAGPIFTHSVEFKVGEVVLRDYATNLPIKEETATLQINNLANGVPAPDTCFWFADLLPVTE